MRQGGVTSAYLFCLYIDDILSEISAEPYGCWHGLTKVNIQAYADDIVVFCPSSTGLRVLLQKVEISLSKHALILNNAKTKCMVFSKQGFNRFTFNRECARV